MLTSPLALFLLCSSPVPPQGYLTIADLYTFFKEIHALWVNMGEYAELEIYDVLDEVMDMIKPATPGRITKVGFCSVRCHHHRWRVGVPHGVCGGEGGGPITKVGLTRVTV